MTGGMRTGATLLVVVTGFGASFAGPTQARKIRPPRGIHLTIRTTTGGIPHIRARDYRSLGFGAGWTQGGAALCTLADAFVTVDAQRSRFFGPDASYDQSYANGTRPNNLQSDFFWAKVMKNRTVEGMLAEPYPAGPERPARQAVRGFAEGYNAALRDRVADGGIKDPACRGEPWVRPVTPMTVWRRIYQLDLLASSGVAIDGITAAAPPGTGVVGLLRARAAQVRALGKIGDGRFDAALGGLGSNAIALGRAATSDGSGMQLGNPHFPWRGPERFYESQLTVPGRMDVAGSSLLGVPAIVNGFTRGLAWSHTVSTARRFVVYELPVSPADPTSYTLAGRSRRMRRTEVTVDVRQPDGTLAKRSHTFYDTELGPVLTSIQGLPVFPWTPASAYVLFDANAGSLGRLVNHYFATGRAQTVAQLDRIERRFQGVPWANTIAADKNGKAYYADIGSMPNVDVDRYASCQTPLGKVVDGQARLAVLDGARAGCLPGGAEGAAAPGLLPPSRQPSLVRDDYVENSNDSYWLVNARRLLTGYSRLIGVERTARLFRTRFGIRSVEQRLAGRDGLPGNRFTLTQLRDLVLDNRNYEAELWLDDVKTLCAQNPMLRTTSGATVQTGPACAALNSYDLRENLDSRGALLWRRFSEHVWLDSDSVDPWADRFDPNDPVNTPRALNIQNDKVKRSFADAISDLQGAKIPFDGPLGNYAYVVRNGERIPIHGGPGVGEFNVILTRFDPKDGYDTVEQGTSYLQAVRVDGRCPRAYTLMAYSQSPDPTSPYYADQTRMYSRKQWVRFRFCPRDIARDPKLRITRIG